MEPGPESIKSLQTSGKMHTGEIPADNVRVAFFSDSLPERNGTGAYYHDLAGQLSPHLESLHISNPTRETFIVFLPMRRSHTTTGDSNYSASGKDSKNSTPI